MPKHKYLVGLDGTLLHVQVPHFDSEVIPGEQVAAAVAEFDIRDRGDDLREEGPVAWVLWLLKNCV